MKQIRNWCYKNKFLTCVIIAVLFMFTFQLIKKGVSVTVPNYGYLQQLFTDGIVIVLAIGVIWALDYKDVVFKKEKGFFSGIVTGGYIMVSSILVIISNVVIAHSSNYLMASNSIIIIYILSMLAVGGAEELFFRGMISNLLFQCFGKSKKGIWFSVVLSGVLFGCMHFMNLSSGIPFNSVLVQVILAGIVGMVLTAIYYRTRNIAVVIFLHAFSDFASLLGTGIYQNGDLVSEIGTYSFANLIAIIPYIIVLLVILRRSKMEEILENNNW